MDAEPDVRPSLDDSSAESDSDSDAAIESDETIALRQHTSDTLSLPDLILLCGECSQMFAEYNASAGNHVAEPSILVIAQLRTQCTFILVCIRTFVLGKQPEQEAEFCSNYNITPEGMSELRLNLIELWDAVNRCSDLKFQDRLIDTTTKVSFSCFLYESLLLLSSILGQTANLEAESLLIDARFPSGSIPGMFATLVVAPYDLVTSEFTEFEVRGWSVISKEDSDDIAGTDMQLAAVYNNLLCFEGDILGVTNRFWDGDRSGVRWIPEEERKWQRMFLSWCFNCIAQRIASPKCPTIHKVCLLADNITRLLLEAHDAIVIAEEDMCDGKLLSISVKKFITEQLDEEALASFEVNLGIVHGMAIDCARRRNFTFMNAWQSNSTNASCTISALTNLQMKRASVSLPPSSVYAESMSSFFKISALKTFKHPTSLMSKKFAPAHQRFFLYMSAMQERMRSTGANDDFCAKWITFVVKDEPMPTNNPELPIPVVFVGILSYFGLQVGRFWIHGDPAALVALWVLLFSPPQRNSRSIRAFLMATEMKSIKCEAVL